MQLVIDFETANRSAASACSVGFVVLEDFKIIHQAEHKIRPPSSEFLFSYIHGITWEQVCTAPTFDQVWQEHLEPWHQKVDTLVGHNIAFDDKVLRMSGAHYGIDVPRIPTECTVKFARYKLGIKPGNLAHVSQTLEIPLVHHHALSDAWASAMIYIHTLTGTKPWLAQTPPTKRPLDDDQFLKLNSAKSAAKLKDLLNQKNSSHSKGSP
jgi:DNA polymerase-3 subunit epsilon